MMMQLEVMDPYAEDFVIFAYILMDHLVVKTHLLKFKKKKKSKYVILYIIM